MPSLSRFLVTHLPSGPRFLVTHLRLWTPEFSSCEKGLAKDGREKLRPFIPRGLTWRRGSAHPPKLQRPPRGGGCSLSLSTQAGESRTEAPVASLGTAVFVRVDARKDTRSALYMEILIIRDSETQTESHPRLETPHPILSLGFSQITGNRRGASAQ